MKPGDRVRITRGEHEGRFGTITDITARRAAVEKILKPSETRTRLLARLDIPEGCHAVQLDDYTSDSDAMGRAVDILRPVITGELAVFPEGSIAPAVRRVTLVAGHDVPSQHPFLAAVSRAARETRSEVVAQPSARRRIPLLRYLNELEEFATAAAMGTNGRLRKEEAGKISDEEAPWARGFTDNIQSFIFAAQPEAIIALIEKLRESVAVLQVINTEHTPIDERVLALQFIEVP